MDSPQDPPPPAYELQHEYDRKISDALERSLHISQPPEQPLEEEDGWEDWDEAKFEAAAAVRAQEESLTNEHAEPAVSSQSSEKEYFTMQGALSSEGASSSTSSPPLVRPLLITKRLPSTPHLAKERPSWLAEAQLDPTSGQSYQTTTNSQIHQLPPEEDEPDEELPPFAAVGPSLEGPPFEDVAREPRRLPIGGASADSPPQSPLDSVEDSDTLSETPSFSPSPLPRGDYRHGSLSPRQSTSPHMLRTSVLPGSSPRPPPMRFDPAVAYTKTLPFSSQPSETESKAPVDASAFYNSSVSSLMGPSQSPHIPKKRTSVTTAALTNTGAYSAGVPAPYPQAPPVPHSAPLRPVSSVPARNSYYPAQNQTYMPNQYNTYQAQQPQQFPAAYGTHASSAPLGPSTPWSPQGDVHGSLYRQ